MKWILALGLVFSSLTVWAVVSDELQGDTLVRTLQNGDSTVVKLKRSSATAVQSAPIVCVSSEESAKAVLTYPGAGGLVLLPGTQLTFRQADSTAAAAAEFAGTYIRVECKGAL